MSREIGFRAWDIKNKRFVNIVRLIFDQFGALDYADVVFEGKIYKLYPSGIVLEQDTGLKDKNGKRIREGDIVRLYGRFISAISWQDGYCGFRWYNNSGDGYCSLSKDNEEYYEVIGNIHDNPELLEDER